MAVRPWSLLSLCDGYGGTELALRSVAPVRTVCRVERDSYAAAVLVARMDEARLDRAPVWDDVCTFDGAAWRGRVDIVAAGFPCQPFSAAGARAGVDDDRWLWPEIGRIVADVEPRYVMLENVPQLVRHGLPEVLHDLAAYGFDAEWGLYAASAVGATHKRERLWIAAEDRTRRIPGSIVDGADEVVGHTAGVGRRSGVGRSTWDRWTVADVADADVGDANGGPLEQPVNDTARHPLARAGRTVFPPRPNDVDGWARWTAEDGPQPTVRRGADGSAVGLADALHLGGNGLVPQCAAEAWRQLLDRL